MSKSNPKPNLQEELDQPHPFEIKEQEVYLNLARTYAVLENDFVKLFREHDLSPPLYNVLRVVMLAGSQGIPSQSIAKYMLSNDPDITRLIDRLEKMELVKRERDSRDRRVIWIKITPAGHEKVERLEPLLQDLHQQQLGHMSAKDLLRLNDLLVEARYPKGS
jgi:DNA-binding MarR family transcriptional regulator